MGLNIAFISIFSVLGLVISLFAGFWVGNRITYIVFVSLVSSLAFGVLGFVIYQILAKKVPEFLDFLSNLSGIIRESGADSMEDMDEARTGIDMTRLDENSTSDSGSFDGISESVQATASKSGKFGDHIMVDKIAIKNEPKLMAEAIRTMMSKDDET